MKVIDEKVSKTEFTKVFKEEVEEFSEHVERVKTQYRELRNLKENLPDHEMIIQMDFAENFACRSADEVQTAYWNQTTVTLHPIVVYYREQSNLKHRSIVVVSDETHHSASTVCAFLDVVIPQLQDIDPDVTKLHYWTDSPSSQYRDRFIFNTIASHEQMYGLHAQWNYFEAGHGKGPCDGLGGTTKRMADEAVRQGKTVIQDPREFFQWAKTSSMKEVCSLFVGKEACEKKKEEFNNLSIKPIKNTMKAHAVVGLSPTMILTKPTSCYCEQCLKGEYCISWTKYSVEVRAKNDDVTRTNKRDERPDRTEKRDERTEGREENTERTEEREERTDRTEEREENTERTDEKEERVNRTDEREERTDRTDGREKRTDRTDEREESPCDQESNKAVEENHDTYVTGPGETNNAIKSLRIWDFVACTYNRNWYIGEILNIDEENQDIEVNFMEKRKELYQWPRRQDKLWVLASEIIRKIEQPAPCGETKRNFRINPNDEKTVQEEFEKRSL